MPDISGEIWLNIDMGLLMTQKDALVDLISHPDQPYSAELQGILNLLDDIHDQLDPPNLSGVPGADI